MFLLVNCQTFQTWFWARFRPVSCLLHSFLHLFGKLWSSFSFINFVLFPCSFRFLRILKNIHFLADLRPLMKANWLIGNHRRIHQFHCEILAKLIVLTKYVWVFLSFKTFRVQFLFPNGHPFSHLLALLLSLSLTFRLLFFFFFLLLSLSFSLMYFSCSRPHSVDTSDYFGTLALLTLNTLDSFVYGFCLYFFKSFLPNRHTCFFVVPFAKLFF